MYAENMPLQVLGKPLVPPRCGIWARRHYAEMAFMNELWFAVVPPPSAPASFYVTAESVDELVGRKGIRLEW